jgi:hypothetical protein
MKRATGHLRLVWVTERRVSPDRRQIDRGGRRATDGGGGIAQPPCDGCGSPTELQWVCGSKDFDQYRCQQCGCRVFAAR